jgi:hypothetical protein
MTPEPIVPEKCRRKFSSKVCHGKLIPHPEIEGVLECRVCKSLYTEAVLKEMP